MCVCIHMYIHIYMYIQYIYVCINIQYVYIYTRFRKYMKFLDWEYRIPRMNEKKQSKRPCSFTSRTLSIASSCGFWASRHTETNQKLHCCTPTSTRLDQNSQLVSISCILLKMFRGKCLLKTTKWWCFLSGINRNFWDTHIWRWFYLRCIKPEERA